MSQHPPGNLSIFRVNMSLRIEHTLRLKKYDEIWHLNIHQLVDDVDFPSYKHPLSSGKNKNALPPPSAHKHARPEAKHLAVQQRGDVFLSCPGVKHSHGA